MKGQIKLTNQNLAAILLMSGEKIIEVSHDENGIYFIFEKNLKNLNTILMFQKQMEFLSVKKEKETSLRGKERQLKSDPFADVKRQFKETTKRIKGAARKTNGVWHQ